MHLKIKEAILEVKRDETSLKVGDSIIEVLSDAPPDTRRTGFQGEKTPSFGKRNKNKKME